MKKEGTDFLVICLYVDDLIYFGTNENLVKMIKKNMMSGFEIRDLGMMKYFQGIQVKKSKGQIFLSQEKYVKDLLKWFHMAKYKVVATPMA